MQNRILIAEEQQECCQLFKEFLQRYGYEVTAVHAGVDCIEALNSGAAYNVLILSWELPGEEGEGILECLEDHGIGPVAVVILTARVDRIRLRKESEFPSVTWVQRPFKLCDLLEAVVSAKPVPRFLTAVGNAGRLSEKNPTGS